VEWGAAVGVVAVWGVEWGAAVGVVAVWGVEWGAAVGGVAVWGARSDNVQPNFQPATKGNIVTHQECEALKSRIRQFETMIESCPVAVLRLDPKGRVRSWNPAAAEIFGWEKDEVLEKPFPGIAPEARETFDMLRKNVRQGRRYAAVDLHLVNKAQVPLFVKTAVMPLKDTQGRVNEIVLMALDVTQSKRTEESLRATEKRHHQLIENLDDVVFTLGSDGRFAYVNSAISVYGYTPKDLLNNSFRDFIHPDDMTAAEVAFARSLRGISGPYELRALDRWGREHYLRIKTRLLETKKKTVSITGVMIDVTELKRAEHQLRAIYRWLPSPVFVWQERGGTISLVEANVAAREITGGAVHDWIGTALGGLPAGWQSFEPPLKRCLIEKTKISEKIEHRLVADEPKRHLNMTYSFVPPDMVLLHMEDVTERKQMEEQLLVAQKMEAVGRLAGGVAHDFNNLLTVINAYTGLVIEKLRESDPIRVDLSEVLNAGQRAAKLTGQLLAFSRRQVLRPEVLDINKTLRDIEDMLRRLIGEDIELSLQLAKRLGHVEVDRGGIEQIVMNLAVNARDAMPKGGRLVIMTANEKLDSQRIVQDMPALSPGRYVHLSVCDTGCGMDEETRARVFEPFFTTKQKDKGTGLGMSTVYGIVKQSNGHIVVHSEPKRGTTFDIFFPRVDAPAHETQKIPRALIEDGKGETLLVVEDEPAVRDLTQRILTGAGYEVLTAANGGEALLVCEEREGKIDLLLTDVVMPKMSGKQLADRLCHLNPTMKVLYMSGYTDDAIEHHGLTEEKVPLISKPFDATALTYKVREVLETK
jgi:PAS domain S-box-containing protein